MVARRSTPPTITCFPWVEVNVVHAGRVRDRGDPRAVGDRQISTGPMYPDVASNVPSFENETESA